MTYIILLVLLAVLSLLVIWWASKLLFKSNWLLGWLRGMAGLLLLTLAIGLALVALDFYSYKQITREENIASIRFTQLDSQRFRAALVDAGGNERRYELSGDLWQLDARIIKWNNTLAGLGMSPGYRLDRLSGRYYSLQEEKAALKTVYGLGGSKSPLDTWQWLKETGAMQSLVDASYGSATYLPMADGALYSVSLSHTGLLARPVNDRAKSAVQGWE